MSISFASSKPQQGSVLIVAMIMLLLLTMIGLASMRDTSLQEAMAGNARDSSLALQSAEAALRKGEAAAFNLSVSQLDAPIFSKIAASYSSSFSGSSAPPEYTVSLLEKLSTSTEMPFDPEFALIKVEAVGYGASVKSNSSPISNTQLRSTYRVDY